MKKIGIMQTAFLGDAVLISSMIGKISERYNNRVEIHLIVKKGMEDVFKYDRRVTSIVTYDKRASESGIIGFYKVCRKIRKLKLDVLFNAHRSFRSSLLAKFSGAKKVAGFKEAPLSFLFDIKVSRAGEHEVFKNHLLLEAFDPEFKNLKPDTNSPYKLYAPGKIDSVDLIELEQNPFIIFAPGSRWHTKRWPYKSYSKLVALILKSYNHSIVFTGDRDDMDYINKIISNTSSSNRIYNLANKLNLTELFYVINKSTLLITNDSAPQHIAVGFNTPVISIFGPTTKDLGFYPFRENAIVIENNSATCRPCGMHGHMNCPKGTHECMRDISCDTVFKAVEKLLSLSAGVFYE